MARVLVDAYHRVIDYLRVSITDLCDLRCIYCRPPEGLKLLSHEEILRYEEILTLVEIFRDMGIRKIRITGGEPLARRGVVDFLTRLKSLGGIEDLALTTNGVRLAVMAKALKATGLCRINVSLDSLRPEVFKAVTGRDRLEDVLSGIHLALEEGFDPVKINVVLLKGLNEQDVPEFGRLTVNMPVDVRFIERMPFVNSSLPYSPDPFSAAQALDIIREQVGEPIPIKRDNLDGPATMFRLKGAKGRIGIIDPVTGHFCGTCNRMRLTARGTLRPCLLGSDEVDIRTPLRAGASREELADIMIGAVLAKPGCRQPHSRGVSDGMSLIGG